MTKQDYLVKSHFEIKEQLAIQFRDCYNLPCDELAFPVTTTQACENPYCKST